MQLSSSFLYTFGAVSKKCQSPPVNHSSFYLSLTCKLLVTLIFGPRRCFKLLCGKQLQPEKWLMNPML